MMANSSGTTSSEATDNSNGGDAGEAEGLAGLHRMSTTAGVTNQGYVAVNQTAIVAVLLGVASAMSFLGWLLLIVPVVGIIFAVVAIRQISDSNGTQTGKGMALLGILLCVLLGGGAVAMGVMANNAVRGDEEKIARTVTDLGRYVREGKYQEAYALFDDQFQARVRFNTFQKTWESLQSPKQVGKLVSMEWNGVTPYFDSAGGAPLAITKARVKFERVNEERFDMDLRKSGDKWLVLRLESFFPTKKGDNFDLSPTGG